MPGGLSSIQNVVGESFSPSGNFEPLAMFLPNLRKQWADNRELIVQGYEDRAKASREESQGRKLTAMGSQAVLGENAIKTGSPEQQQATGEMISRQAEQTAALKFKDVGPQEKSRLGVIGERARTAAGLSPADIANRTEAGKQADVATGASLKVLAGLTPEQRTAVRQAYAAATIETGQQKQRAKFETGEINARTKFQTGQVNARANYAFNLVDHKEKLESTADHDALVAISESNTLPPELQKAVGSLLGSNIKKDSPVFADFFKTIQTHGYPTTQVTLSGSVDQKSTTAQLEKDLIETQTSLVQMDSIRRNFDPRALTLVGAVRSAGGNFAEWLTGAPIDKNFRKSISSMIASSLLNKNLYIHKITGAQMSPFETQRYDDAYPDAQKDPATPFVAKYNVVVEMLGALAQLQQDQLSLGVNPNSPEALAASQRIIRKYGATLESIGEMPEDQLSAFIPEAATSRTTGNNLTPEVIDGLSDKAVKKLAAERKRQMGIQ